MKRSAPFVALERDCKRAAKQLSKTYGFWFRRIYNLAPTDPRFLDATPEQIITDYWAHYYLTRAAAGRDTEEEFEDEDFEVEGHGELDAFPTHLLPNDFEEIDLTTVGDDGAGN
ncbi:MAG TPA: hypothetical protein VJP88_04575 [Caulobacteraceae bacterium]|nr:hypothetical protein [Caulobacteraceae bacterium]